MICKMASLLTAILLCLISVSSAHAKKPKQQSLDQGGYYVGSEIANENPETAFEGFEGSRGEPSQERVPQGSKPTSLTREFPYMETLQNTPHNVNMIWFISGDSRERHTDNMAQAIKVMTLIIDKFKQSKAKVYLNLGVYADKGEGRGQINDPKIKDLKGKVKTLNDRSEFFYYPPLDGPIKRTRALMHAMAFFMSYKKNIRNGTWQHMFQERHPEQHNIVVFVTQDDSKKYPPKRRGWFSFWVVLAVLFTAGALSGIMPLISGLIAGGGSAIAHVLSRNRQLERNRKKLIAELQENEKRNHYKYDTLLKVTDAFFGNVSKSEEKKRNYEIWAIVGAAPQKNYFQHSSSRWKMIESGTAGKYDLQYWDDGKEQKKEGEYTLSQWDAFKAGEFSSFENYAKHRPDYCYHPDSTKQSKLKGAPSYTDLCRPRYLKSTMPNNRSFMRTIDKKCSNPPKNPYNIESLKDHRDTCQYFCEINYTHHKRRHPLSREQREQYEELDAQRSQGHRNLLTKLYQEQQRKNNDNFFENISLSGGWNPDRDKEPLPNDLEDLAFDDPAFKGVRREFRRSTRWSQLSPEACRSIYRGIQRDPIWNSLDTTKHRAFPNGFPTVSVAIKQKDPQLNRLCEPSSDSKRVADLIWPWEKGEDFSNSALAVNYLGCEQNGSFQPRAITDIYDKAAQILQNDNHKYAPLCLKVCQTGPSQSPGGCALRKGWEYIKAARKTFGLSFDPCTPEKDYKDILRKQLTDENSLFKKIDLVINFGNRMRGEDRDKEKVQVAPKKITSMTIEYKNGSTESADDAIIQALNKDLKNQNKKKKFFRKKSMFLPMSPSRLNELEKQGVIDNKMKWEKFQEHLLYGEKKSKLVITYEPKNSS